MFKKIKLQNVRDTVGTGWVHELYYCGSNQQPTEDRSVSSVLFRDRAMFERWHTNTKKKICSDTNGKTLKYYVKVN